VTRHLVLLVLLLSSPAIAQQVEQAPLEPLVVVAGESVLRVAPDRAWITVGAESRAPGPADAQRRNTEAMTPVLAQLKAAGVPPDAIRTVVYELEYEYDFVDNRRVGRGYVARNMVEVRVDDVDRLGGLLEIAVGSGATTLSGIRFDLKDRAAREREALREAVAEARAKIQAAASGAGRAIDRIVRIEEQGVVSTPPPRPLLREVQALAADVPAPVSAGQIEIRANVIVTATLK
jgi:hypothetical protein